MAGGSDGEPSGDGKPGQAKMSDSERTEMMKKMDKDLEEHFAKLEAKAAERGPMGKMEGGWSEDNWEEEMQQHPFFNQGWKEGKELSPMMQGLQDLKYSPDENSPDELAKNYKEDGNFNFKCKKYRFAIASYTEGLKAKSPDVEVNTQLLTNRAAAQFHIGNYRSSLLDCKAALLVTDTHMKAILRGAQCLFQLKHHTECQTWCDRGLKIDSSQAELLKIRTDSARIQKELDRDTRRRAAAEKKKKQEENQILEVIRQRGINVQKKIGDTLTLSDLEPCHPAAVQKRVHLDSGELVWPVLFLYPEIGETDFIEEFRESEKFEQHVDIMFGAAAERPPWDQQSRYTPNSLVIYFENRDCDLQEVPQDWTLVQALTSKKCLLKAGTPGFILLVRNSKSHIDFIGKYKIV